MAVVPEILPGVEGTVFTVMANVDAALLPQAFAAVTAMFPLVTLAVVLMELVVEEPLQPEGNVQVYEVAPETAAME